MYIPSAFKVEEASALRTFIERHGFATIISESTSGLFASHVPLLLTSKDGVPAILSGHVAIANPQWRHFESAKEVMCIFQGPHSYISPKWYQTSPAVPTWNYAAVHAYGRPAVITDETVLSTILEETIRQYEGGDAEDYQRSLPQEYRAKMMKGIVGFQIEITRLEGKFKLGQNRSPEDALGVYNHLISSQDSDARKLADLMRERGVVGSIP